MAAPGALDAGFLVGAEDVVLRAKGAALPTARIQIQDRPCLLSKLADHEGRSSTCNANGLRASRRAPATPCSD